MMNTLKQNNIQLISDKLAAKQKNKVGFVQNGNPNYTHPQGIADKIKAAIIKLASTNSKTAALVDKIKGENLFSVDRIKSTDSQQQEKEYRR